MKQSERLLRDAEAVMRIIEGYRNDITVRQNQIQKIEQEIAGFNDLIVKEQAKHNSLIEQSQQEQQKEADEESRRYQQIAMRAAENSADARN